MLLGTRWLQTHVADLFNIVLGLSAIGYSWMPAERVRNYRRGVALSMRILGIVLVAISTTNVLMEIGHHP